MSVFLHMQACIMCKVCICIHACICQGAHVCADIGTCLWRLQVATSILPDHSSVFKYKLTFAYCVCASLCLQSVPLSDSVCLSACVCLCLCACAHMCYDLPPVEVRGQLQGVISPSPNCILEIKLRLSVLVTSAFLQCTYHWSTTLFFVAWPLAESSYLCLPSDGIAGGYQSCLFSMWVLWIWTPDFTSVWQVLYLQNWLLSYKFVNLQFVSSLLESTERSQKKSDDIQSEVHCNSHYNVKKHRIL